MTGSTRMKRAHAGLPPGLLLGALGVLAFSFSYPATRLAVVDLDPLFVAFGRAAVAGLLAVAYLLAVRAPRPSALQWKSLAIVAAFVVIGFPTLTGIALQAKTSAHVAVITALMPAATAVAAVVRAGERPSRMFWVAAATGAVAVIAFAVSQGAGGLDADDLLLLVAVVIIGIGYAEGGALSRALGGARTICWALLLALPLTIPVSLLVAGRSDFSTVESSAWCGFAYVSLFSMFLGFFAWYGGLARGGVARIGQVQLAQPLLTLVFAVAVLGETVTPATALTAVVVLACVVATQRARVGQVRGTAAGGAAAEPLAASAPPGD
ncbi:MAG: DMT family transporter [Chloroflexi bacterium]|nr:DMT family transporter [Chloroflexota bacterium]